MREYLRTVYMHILSGSNQLHKEFGISADLQLNQKKKKKYLAMCSNLLN